VHLAYICIVCHLSAKNYQNRWKFDAVLTKTNLLSFFWDTAHRLFAHCKTSKCLINPHWT